MKKSKKAAFIVREYNENVFYGGGEKVNYYIILELIRRDYTVDIFTDNSYVEKSSLVNIHIKNNNYKEELKNYDLVLSTNCECESNITFSHNHSYKYEQTLNKIPNIFKLLFSKSHNKKLKRDKDAKQNVGLISNIVVSSNILKEDYVENYEIPKWKIHILPPAVEYKETNIKLPNKRCINFGLVAGKFAYKGGFITLFAASKLKKKYKNFKVRIIIKNNKKLLMLFCKFIGISNFVEFLPAQKDMTNFYESIDFMLVPSIKEPFGLVVTEAMSFSKIPILSSVCGAIDLIIDNKNGMIIDYSKKNKVQMLANKMEEAILISDAKYKEIALNANNSVKNLSWKKFACEYIDIAEEKTNLNDIKVSVIIPVYNAEKYLAECLNSIVNQSLKEIEIICINDGSSDNSLKLIEKYARFNKRIKIINKEASGSASAGRNIGIKLSKGEYICFIDNDDFISLDYLEKMYVKAKETNADLVTNNNINAFIEKNLKKQKRYLKTNVINSLAWSKLYKRDIIIKNSLRFPEGYIYEDEYFYYTLIPYIKNSVQYNCGMYYYRQSKSSLMGKGKTEKKYQIIDIFRLIYNFYKEHNFLFEYKLPYSILKYRSSQISDYKRYRNKFLELINELNLDIEEIKKDKKLRLLLISPNKFLYRINGIFNNKIKTELSEEYKMLYELDED